MELPALTYACLAVAAGATAFHAWFFRSARALAGAAEANDQADRRAEALQRMHWAILAARTAAIFAAFAVLSLPATVWIRIPVALAAASVLPALLLLALHGVRPRSRRDFLWLVGA